jgi:hypothetical protein
MTAAQSWAFVTVVVLAVLCLVYLIAELDRASLKRRMAAIEGAPAPKDTAEESKLCPALDLVEGSTEAPQGPREVYDWAIKGI